MEIGNKQPHEVSPVELQGDSYDALRQADPYANIEVERTFMDRMANFFGFRSGADKRSYELEQLSNEYQAGIAQQKFENEFNSEVEKANRMRMAGMNPDLLGTSGVSGASTHDAQHNSSTAIDGMRTGADVATTFFNVVTSAVSIAHSFFGLKGAQLDNAQKLTDVITSASDYGKNWITNNFQEGMWLNTHHFGKYLGRNNPIVSQAIKDGMDSLLAETADGDIVGTARLMAGYDADKLSSAKNRFERATLEGSKYYSGEMETMKTLAGIFTDLNLESRKSQDQYTSDYYGERSGITAAQADQASDEFTLGEKDMTNEIRDVKRKVVKALSKQSEQGNITSTIALLLFSMMPNSLSMGSSDGPKGSTTSTSIGF